MREEQTKIEDAVDAVIDLIFAERLFNPDIDEEGKQELKLSIYAKLQEYGVELVEIEDRE